MEEMRIKKLPSDSSILSHSSRMKCITFIKERSFSLARARILPVVPTTVRMANKSLVFIYVNTSIE
jgi:hypothetical protein